MLSPFVRKHFIVYGFCADKLKEHGLAPSALKLVLAYRNKLAFHVVYREKAFLLFAKIYPRSISTKHLPFIRVILKH